MQIISPQQILVPKKVYIGDTAELRCTFNSPEPLLKNLTQNGAVELPLNNFPFLASEDFDIKEIKLLPAGVDYYQLSITFVPWKTGSIQFEPLILSSHKKEDTEATESAVTIEFQPLQIVSLISSENAANTSLHDTAAPLLLPGTAYKLYGTLAASICLLIIVIRLFVKRKSLAFYINQKKLLKKYKKNKKQTIRLLYKIADQAEEADFDHKAEAENMQKALRNYLEVRFGYPFTHTVTSEIMKGWQEATQGLLSDTKEEAFGEIAESFIRTDYIRYSKNGRFAADELAKLIEKLVSDIDILEKAEEARA